MEPYRNYGRGSYGRNGGSCGMNQRGINTNCGRNMNQGMNLGMNQNMNHGMRTDSGCGCGSSPKMNTDCDCGDNNSHMRHMPVAMAYVPMQQWSSLNDPEKALCQGTAFPELNLIFCGSRGKM